jgi:hypothetical protein
MSRKSGKEKFMLFGGPFDREIVKLSSSAGNSHATLIFAVKGQIGRYINGRWNPYEDPTALNENIVLGEM